MEYLTVFQYFYGMLTSSRYVTLSKTGFRPKKWRTNTERSPVSLKYQNVSENFQQFLDKVNPWMNFLTCVRSAKN